MNEKNLKYYVIGALLIVVLVIGYFIWQSGNISNHGGGALAIGTQLGDAGDAIDSGTGHAGNAERGIERAAGRIGSSLDRVDRIEERNSEITSRLTESIRLNHESQSIIRAVRERGATGSE